MQATPSPARAGDESVRRWLAEGEACRRAIALRQSHIAELEARASAVSAAPFSGAPGCHAADSASQAALRREELLCRLADEKAALARAVESEARRRTRLAAACRALADPLERLVVEERYLDGRPWGEICRAAHYSRTSVYRAHRAALAHLSLGPEV